MNRPAATGKENLLGEILIEAVGLGQSQLHAALAEQQDSDRPLGDLLVEMGFITEKELFETLGRQLGFPYLDRPDLGTVDPDLLARLSVPFLLRHKVVPARQEDGRVLVATLNPFDLAPIDALGKIMGVRTEPALVPERAIQSAIQSLYEREEHSAKAMIQELDGAGESIEIGQESELGEELDLSHEAPVIKLVNRVIHQAARNRASDVHWEPFEKEMKVRLRIDGILHDNLRFDKLHQLAVTSRLKVMAGMDIAERRLPQDGRIQRKVGGRDIDMRVAAIPTVHGERIVLRLLDRSSILLNLRDLGFPTDQYETFRRLIGRPHGMVLVTGPTGSGKTTTLYSAIQMIRSTETNIMTIEDPVEYQLDGVAQMQVAPKTGFTFASGLRAILRQDPDVVLVGEIRDRETAEVAIHASLTGHLVFSTLHTNDAVGAITRLLDMGVEPFLISSSVIGVMAQRLVRRICPHCEEEAPVNPEALRNVLIEEEKIAALSRSLKRGAGCSECYHTGYRGRIGIFELLEIDDEMRGLIMAHSDAVALKAAAIQKGMATLVQAGGEKVAAGIATPEEVVRIDQA